MEDNISDHAASLPLPRFSFSVDFGTLMTNVSFQEVTVLDAKTQSIEYRHGNGSTFSTIKVPGIKKYCNITLKKGILVKDNTFLIGTPKYQLIPLSVRLLLLSYLTKTGNRP